MFEDLLTEFNPHFQKTIEHLHHDLAGIRTGRANPALLNSVHVEAYGISQPLNQVANVSVSDNRTLVVTPWDKGLVSTIDKAIQAANLGLNPSSDGQLLRINLPPLSEERRKELVKVVGGLAEKARIGIRSVREDMLKSAKKSEAEGGMSKDDMVHIQKKVQEVVDKLNEEIKNIVADKEKEVMTV